jgi:hypothetical protein
MSSKAALKQMEKEHTHVLAKESQLNTQNFQADQIRLHSLEKMRQREICKLYQFNMSENANKKFLFKEQQIKGESN